MARIDVVGSLFDAVFRSGRAGRAVVFGVAWVIGLTALAIRLATARQWVGAGFALLAVLTPLAIGAVIWRGNRKAESEEALRARSPLNLP